MSQSIGINSIHNAIKINPVLESASSSLRKELGEDESSHAKRLQQNQIETKKISDLYEFEETIGKGHFAVVKLARHVFSGEKVAVKIIDKNKLDQISREHLFQEVKCMKLVQHPNVVRLYDVIDSPSKLYLILELGDGGDMYDYIMKHTNGLGERKAKYYFRQIVKAVKYCHDKFVVHRDLKPENVVFFQKTGQVKLTDFGFSNIFKQDVKLLTSCGSLAYSAPEVLLGDSYFAPAVDIWSLGVILYMLVCGRAPFQEANDNETLTMILDCKFYLPSNLSFECCDLISRMLKRDPNKRISLNDVCRHEWLAHTSNEASEENDETEIDIGKPKSTTNLSPKRFNSDDEMPLLKREHLSNQDNEEILNSMVQGQIAKREEILECLDQHKYNYITATYYLLAERLYRKNYFKKRKQRFSNRQSEKSSKKPTTTATTTTTTTMTTLMRTSSEEKENELADGHSSNSVKRKLANNLNSTNNAHVISTHSAKTGYNNLKVQRNHLIRQNEEDEEAELKEATQQQHQQQQQQLLKEQFNSKSNEPNNGINDTSENFNGTFPPSLTNILEDEEDSLFVDNEPNNNTQSNRNAFNKTSLSKKPSNQLSTMIILEEVECDSSTQHEKDEDELRKLSPLDEHSSELLIENDSNSELNQRTLTPNDSQTLLSKGFHRTSSAKMPTKSARLTSTSGTETSCSDNSDCEFKLTQDFGFNNENNNLNRSSSSRSRLRFSNKQLMMDNESLKVKNISNKALSMTSSKEEIEQDNAMFGRTKSLIEQTSSLNNNNNNNSNNINSNGPFSVSVNKQSLSMSSNDSHEPFLNNYLPMNHSNGKNLSVEHRISNFSQISLGSQLSKNNSVRFHSRSMTAEHSATPTPRESIVFKRGDEKPIAKILLGQLSYQQAKSENEIDLNEDNVSELFEHTLNDSNTLTDNDNEQTAKENNSIQQSKQQEKSASETPSKIANSSNKSNQQCELKQTVDSPKLKKINESQMRREEDSLTNGLDSIDSRNLTNKIVNNNVAKPMPNQIDEIKTRIKNNSKDICSTNSTTRIKNEIKLEEPQTELKSAESTLDTIELNQHNSNNNQFKSNTNQEENQGDKQSLSSNSKSKTKPIKQPNYKSNQVNCIKKNDLTSDQTVNTKNCNNCCIII